MRWIEKGLGPVPIEFRKLVDATLPAGELRIALDQLIAAKTAGAELDVGPRIPIISDFIEGELVRLEPLAAVQITAAPPTDWLDGLFRATLAEVWGAV